MSAHTADVRAAIERIHRDEHGRIVASLARRFGDLGLAEDAAGEALVAALEQWPSRGTPSNPGAWLTTAATRRAIDRIRREALRDTKHRQALLIVDDTPHASTGAVDDDRLRLLFTCCHPVLAVEAQVALTLRLLGGLTVEEIARAFFVAETTMARRITRAKAKIAAERIAFTVPDDGDVAERLGPVLAVVHLVFNEGYLAGAGDEAIRADLTDEAIRLGRMLRALLPDEGEVAGLLAMMLLIEARRRTRVAGGELVTLAEQDRGSWDRDLVAEGHALVRECLARVASGASGPGQFQLMAAINAVHTDAADARDTDWDQVVRLYDQLYAIVPTDVVAMNRAVAIAELDGPAVALGIVDGLELDGHHAWHATRADLLRRLGRSADARQAYSEAIAASDNPAEQAYLRRRRDQLAVGGRGDDGVTTC